MMRLIMIRLSLLLLLILFSNPLFAASLTGYQILERMEHYQRSITDSSFVESRLSSCRYGIKNSKIACVEKPRIKLLEAVGVNEGEKKRDTRSVTIVLAPADEKGVGMLNHTYDEPGKDNETWLYLSALGRIKRIASGNSDDQSEPASLFGSEFSTEDLDTGKLDEYDIQLREQTEIFGRPVWKIETIPNPERAKKTRYGRSIYYVDQQRFVALRVDMFDRQGREIKRLMASSIEQVNNVWVARSLTMLNLISHRLSNMVRNKIALDVKIQADFLSQRTLTDVAFRERELEKLRSQVK